jgi:aminocarboxymuconate-semialdehyde decarboxylase
MTTGHGCIDVHGHGVPRDFMEWAATSLPGGTDVQRTDKGSYVVTFPGARPTRPLKAQLFDLEQRVSWLDAQGAAVQLVGPWLDVMGQELPPDVGGEWVRRLNDSLAAATAGTGGRFRALATMHLADPKAAVAELERCAAELGMTGALVPTDFPVGDLADPEYSVVFEAAAALRMPFILHPPTIGPSSCVAGMKTWGAVYGRLLDTTMAAARLISIGVFDKHPDLQIVLVHGGGMLPFQFGRLERHIADRAVGGGSSPASAEGHVKCFYYDTVLMEPSALRLLTELVGTERILIGSDYPFVDDKPPLLGAVGQLTLSDDDRQAVLRENAAALFRVNLGGGSAGKAAGDGGN